MKPGKHNLNAIDIDSLCVSVGSPNLLIIFQNGLQAPTKFVEGNNFTIISFCERKYCQFQPITANQVYYLIYKLIKTYLYSLHGTYVNTPLAILTSRPDRKKIRIVARNYSIISICKFRRI